ncbi:streptococcal hemagglutinin-like [Dermacentor albipictus]|uniref:streptococcal hemagglutinin-like n=1 Tax=Dermacentor albipictus TaxID=60249 RepID=UPI0031FDF590
MAGMAWTLHPALFYEKYGTVLVQLWDSGAMSTLFRPVRRLSKTIGDALAARRRRSCTAEPDVPEGETSALQLTDETVPTSDEAQGRAYFVPGDTSSSPSSSEENELAFQGDVYTQMRRSRRQAERTKKIREARKQFLEGTSGRRSAKRRRSRRRSSLLMSSSVRQTLHGTGTPLTEIEDSEKPRVIIADAASSPTPASGELSPEMSEGAKEGAADDGAGRGPAVGPAELMDDNDSLRRFRAIHGRKTVSRSPPPCVTSDSSDSVTDLDRGVASGHVIVPQDLLPDNDSVYKFRAIHGRMTIANPSLSEDSSLQPEPMGDLRRGGKPAQTITPDELLPDNDSVYKFRAIHGRMKIATPSLSEDSSLQPKPMGDLRRGGKPAHTITPDELLPDNDSLWKFRATHAEKARSSQSLSASSQLESQTEFQPAQIRLAARSVVDGPISDSQDITAMEGRTMKSAVGKTQARALLEASNLDRSKDSSTLSMQISPPDTDIQNSSSRQNEVPTSPLKASKKKITEANGDSGQLKTVSETLKGKKSKRSHDRQKPLEYASGLDATGVGTPAARSGETTRNNSALSTECLSGGARTQIEGQDVEAKRRPIVVETRAEIKEASEKDSALPLAERSAEVQRAPGNVQASASGTFGLHPESEGSNQDVRAHTESQQIWKSSEPPQRAETGIRMSVSEEDQKNRPTEAATPSVSSISIGTTIHESDDLGQATSTDETVGKPRKKTNSVKWGKRHVKRHKKRHKRCPPVSFTFENTSQALGTSRRSVLDSTSTEGSAQSPSLAISASQAAGTSGRHGRRQSGRRSSKGQTKEDTEIQFRKAKKRSDKKSRAKPVVTGPDTGADAVSPETKQEASRTASSPAFKSTSTALASGVVSETASRDSVREVQVGSSQTTVPSSCSEPSVSETTVTPVLATAGPSSRAQPQQHAAKLQGKDPTRRRDDPSRDNNGPTSWPFSPNPSTKK